MRAEGRFPLILLSHGTGGSAQIMAWLARGLASAGFIVAAVNHPGNNALEPYTAEGFLVWWERAKDLSTVLDFMLRDVDFAVDGRRIGAIGYSLGGYTMFEIAGARTDPALLRKFCASSQAEGCDDPPEFPNLFARWSELDATNSQFQAEVKEAGRSHRDNRIRAVFAIAPALGPALISSTVQRIRIPVAIVAGQNDRIVPIASNAQRLARLTPKARLTLLPGAAHYTFLAICTDRGRREQAQLCLDVP
jgi:predicted dienelactone hydrolase